jgi:four helix bundle protein
MIHMHDFRKLKVWEKAMELSTEIYKCTASFPQEEKFGLTSQMRKCSVSIPSNISEGAGRNSKGEFKHFLGISNGSAFELMTQTMLAVRLGLLSEESSRRLIQTLEEIQKMIYGLISSMGN